MSLPKHATMHFLSVLVLVALLSIATCQRLGEWRNLAKSGSLPALSKRRYAFPPSDNLKICRRRVIRVPRDGRSDYTAIFNEKMALLRRLGGGTLKLDAGLYPHKGHIIIPSYVCLIGAGMEKTVIRLVNFAPRFPKAGSIRSFQTERVSILDLTQDGNRANQRSGKKQAYGRYGFFSELTNFLLLRNVRVRNNKGYGFDPHGSKKYWAYYLVMENCRAHFNELDGFTIDQTVHASILGGISTLNDRHGYNIVTGTRLALFRGCSAVNNGKRSRVGYGFVAQNNQNYGTGRLAFERCSERGSWRGAMKLRDVFQVYISDSTFNGGGNSLCYELAKARGVMLRNNACRVPRNRKFKLQGRNTYQEVKDRSVFPKILRAPPPMAKFADPACKKGRRLAGTNVCCAAACKRCGGMGCGTKMNGPGPKVCCVGPVQTTGRKCGVTGAPCMMG